MNDQIRTILKKNYSLPGHAKAEEAVKSFSPSERGVFYLFALLLTLAALGLLWNLNGHIMVQVPTKGGHLTEGITGYPRFINPLLSITDADKDMTALTYSGLLKATPEGELIPDLAESYSISEDKLTYAFVLKDNISFHDGKPVTADDVVFTVEKAQDELLQSPRRPNWAGVTVKKINDKEVHFVLKQPYAPFIANATIGILPKHIWVNIPTEQFAWSTVNLEPIGSGPYKIEKMGKKDEGTKTSLGILEYYTLVPFEHYALGEPLISRITLRFYPNEEATIGAYNNKEVESIAAISAQNAKTIAAKDDVRIEQIPLTRIFAVFLNQNEAPILRERSVRRALSAAVNKKKIIDEVLHGYGTVTDGPIPPGMLPDKSSAALVSDGEKETMTDTERIEAAKNILLQSGWTWNGETSKMEKKSKNETTGLSFSISTSDAPELRQTAIILKQQWESIGATIDIKIFEIGNLNQNIIRPRKYDTLLFGEVIGRDLDLYAFWHSSQRNDPGLNINLYANVKTDKLLDEVRTVSDKRERLAKYRAFEEEIQNDTPAIFLYSPDFIYVLPEKIKGFTLATITDPSDRFGRIEEWYIETSGVWKVFAQ